MQYNISIRNLLLTFSSLRFLLFQERIFTNEKTRQFYLGKFYLGKWPFVPTFLYYVLSHFSRSLHTFGWELSWEYI